MATLDDAVASLNDATAGFKQMQTALIIFCGLVGISILIVSAAIFNTTKK